MKLIAHGGAGGDPDQPEQRQAVLNEAVDRGAGAQTPLDAVETTLRHLESNPRFNVGVGGAVQSDGVSRTEAGLMTGEGNVGAAASMAGVEHAVSVARIVLEETPHVLLTGDHATELASDYGIETDRDLISESARERWDTAPAPPTDGPRAQLEWVQEQFGGSDTVGAVATDGISIAVATATAGRWFALAGRVGDVPQVGSGFYASETAAASATGAGEDIARSTLARLAVRHVDDGATPKAAAEAALTEFEALTESTAGIIVMDQKGRRGSAFNSASMQTASDTDR
ncbi:MAG: isoaspartyl peptidase/L-asparaginase [Halodesulfurarchaeum sp.]|nr:isoaspartyl peptidase/L-asparaginase [Halodesulfurarchaeum sp.]